MKSSARRPDELSNSGTHTDALNDSKGLVSADRAAHEEILHLARTIWERKGRPEGSDLENWLEAEREILSRRVSR